MDFFDFSVVFFFLIFCMLECFLALLRYYWQIKVTYIKTVQHDFLNLSKIYYIEV